MDLPPQVAYCPHCGNTAPQDLSSVFLCIEHAQQDVPSFPVRAAARKDARSYVMTQCCTCNHVLLYEAKRDDGVVRLDKAVLLWPEAGRLHNAIPEKVRDSYEKAARLKPIHPPAFANQIGVAMERLCKDQRAEGGTLAAKLRDLRAKHILPDILADMAEKVRAFRNLGSHADDDDEVTPADADAIDEFFRAVVEYVYVAPYRVAEVKKRLGASGGA